MDISQLAQCLRALVAENDEVAVPHLGVFSSELMPASFSENLSTINPPYRKIYFRKEDISAEDAFSFVDGVAKLRGISFDEAQNELSWCVGRLISILEGDRVCELPGFGKMKTNSSNDFFFVPEENLDIFADTLGLESIHLRVAPEPQLEPQPELQLEPQLEPQPELQPESQPEPAPEKPQTQQTPPALKSPRKRLAAGWIVLIALLVAVVLVAVLLILFPEQASYILDRILYTKEELELIEWGNL